MFCSMWFFLERKCKKENQNQRQAQKQVYTLLQIEAAAITTTIAEAEERLAAFVVAVAVVGVVALVAVVVAVVLDSFISIVKFAINCSSAAQRQPSANYVHASNRYRYRNRSVTDTRGHSSGRCRQSYIQIQIQAVLWIQIQRIRNYKFTVYKYSVQHSE